MLRADIFFPEMTGFACILELLAEPLYIISQKKKYYNIRVYAEPAATVFRCLTTFILVKGRIKVVIVTSHLFY